MKTGYEEAIEILMNAAGALGTENIPTDELFSRVLAEDLVSDENVPDFSRSPYDGYAFKASDTKGADKQNTLTLKVIENIKAGQTPENKVTEGCAIRLMTGAPVPEGADAVCKYEDTDFTEETVTLNREYRPGENIIWPGEDIKKGTLLVKKGTVIDAAITGIVASLGKTGMPVYKRPVAAVISTGDEVVDINQTPGFGKIRDSNRYTISAALKQTGIDTIFAGHTEDDTGKIKDSILSAEKYSDIIITTGGVSAGDYDLVPEAMEKAGYEILIHGIDMKPGMACAYGIKDKRLLFALSGNPAASLTNLQCICYPALRKLAGIKDPEHKPIKMRLKNDIKKGGRGVRFIRGRLSIEEGSAFFDPAYEQGNIVISSAALCNAYALVLEGRAPLYAGEYVEGFTV